MKLLADGAKELGIGLSVGQLEQFELYHRELAEWNQRANLTSITGDEETQVGHFLDSLTAGLPFLEGGDNSSIRPAGGCQGGGRGQRGWLSGTAVEAGVSGSGIALD